MGVAQLGDHQFRLDPTSVSWDFTIKQADMKTVGGKVLQVFGATLGDMTVTGTFGKGGWREQEAFLDKMKKIGDEMVADGRRVSNSQTPPLHFLYPPKEWDLLVYLTEYTEPGAAASIDLRNDNIAPKWRLTLFIVEDNGGLRQATANAYIARLSKGLGWKKTTYNGPLNVAEYEAASQALAAAGGGTNG